ncbi:hypothetical protein HYS28_02990 [Candidatus Uhrbacteria bacterium]|nr:hypothetical protein [Candidatus Uhrbacteria bacterium]
MNRTQTVPGLVTSFVRRPWMDKVEPAGKVIGKILDGFTPTWIVETDICLVRVRFDGNTPVVEQPQPIKGVGGRTPKIGHVQAKVDAIVTALTSASYQPRLAA